MLRILSQPKPYLVWIELDVLRKTQGPANSMALLLGIGNPLTEKLRTLSKQAPTFCLTSRPLRIPCLDKTLAQRLNGTAAVFYTFAADIRYLDSQTGNLQI